MAKPAPKKKTPAKKAPAKKAPARKARPAPKKPAPKKPAKPAPKPKKAAKPAKKATPRKVAKPAPKKVAKPVAKPAVHKPVVKPAAPKPAAKPVEAKPVAPVAPAPAAVPAPAPAKPQAQAAPRKPSFKIGEQIVYPAHGVGRITNIEEQEIAGVKLELYIVDFEKEKLRLKVPTNRAEQKGMRRLADRALIEHAMKVIRGRARIKRTMWSRRAQEYDAKINSGDIIAVAEVVRDLYRSDRQPEQSYSERQLFEQALMRFARELAAVRKVDDDQCVKELEDYLAKNAKRGAATEKDGDDAAEEAA
jgi:CarD family transcriptional regulator